MNVKLFISDMTTDRGLAMHWSDTKWSVFDLLKRSMAKTSG